MQHAYPPVDGGRRSLSTGDAARRVGCHPVTIWRAVTNGELPAVRLGRHGNYRIALEELEEWLQPTRTEDE